MSNKNSSFRSVVLIGITCWLATVAGLATIVFQASSSNALFALGLMSAWSFVPYAILFLTARFLVPRLFSYGAILRWRASSL